MSGSALLDAVVIFGGTFDPPHQGHITVLRSLCETFSTVIIAPTAQNPWKGSSVATIDQRLEMLRIVLRQQNVPFTDLSQDTKQLPAQGVVLSTIPYTYSVELLDQLRELAPRRAFVWALGTDQDGAQNKWLDWSNRGCPITTVPVRIDIHSTAIRNGEKPVLEELKDFASKHGLYQQS